MFTRKVSYTVGVTKTIEIPEYVLDMLRRKHDESIALKGRPDKIACIKLLRDECAMYLADGSAMKIRLLDAKNIVEDFLQIAR